MRDSIVFLEISSANAFVTRKHHERFLIKNEETSFSRIVARTKGKKTICNHRGRGTTSDPPEFKAAFLRITSADMHLPNRRFPGYVVGSDPNYCDILVGYRPEGVSGRHFVIQPLERPGRWMLNDLSSHGTYCRNFRAEPYTSMKDEPAILDQPGNLYIHIPGASMTLHCPKISNYNDFSSTWSKLYTHCKQYQDRLDLESLSLAPPPSSTQALVSNYVLKQRVGQCGTAIIFSAEHRDRRQGLFMVKKWKDTRAAEYEVHILSHIEHANIFKFVDYVPPLDFSDAEIMVEHVGGRSLSQEHSSHPFTVLELQQLAAQLTSALEHLHRLGYVHGDVNLENAWLKSRQPIDLRLFGFKNVSLGNAALSGISAPELKGGQDYTYKADIWSLGITLMTIYVGLPQTRNDVSYRDLVSHLFLFGQQCKSGVQFISHLLRDAPDRRLEGKRLLEDRFLQETPENADLSLPFTTSYEPYDGYDSDASSLPDTLRPDDCVSEQSF